MIRWHLNRLKTFSIPEFPYRVKQVLQKKYQKHFLQHKNIDPAKYKVEKRILEEVSFNTESEAPVINIFGKKFNFSDPDNIDWHEDVFSNQSFPKIFSKSINILSDPSLSAKAVWEVNRLQFLMKIAIDYNRTKDDVHLYIFIKILKSWILDNPYLHGINWYSNIEVNLRLINWFLCWEVLDADSLMVENKTFKEFAEKDWIPSIYSHCIYSYQNPSKYSSANNHLVSEYSGLFVACSKWKFQESEKWKQYSKKGLEEEIVKQHSPKGINKEEAAEYIQFITDFFLIAFIVGEKTKNPFNLKYKSYLHNIFNYIFNFLDSKANFPPYGDEDDGKCFIVDFDEGFNNFKSLLTSGTIIFQDPRLKIKSNGFDLKNKLLFGESGRNAFESVPLVSIEEKSELYKEEGHFFFRKKDDNDEIYLHFDAAPLGFLSIAAHGHADALSFILHVDGQPFFIDSGTYTYHTESLWRDYFMGTLAHNTIRINKLNQATIGGPTLWLKHYKTKVLKAESNEDYDLVSAQHNGYENLGISHRREIIFEKKNQTIKIFDNIDCQKPDTFLVEMPFHIHPLIRVNSIKKNQFELTSSKKTNLTLQTDLKLITKLVRGQTEPEITGWYSKSFMSKEPCNTIICSIEAVGNIKLETVISIN
ncbi:MAG TPA: alginate lyase family protein [Hanamia sp.]